MIVATFVLFLIPLAILLLALTDALNQRKLSSQQNWRSYFQGLALAAAAIATLTALGFNLSWTHNGGSPHGMAPGPGLWMILRPTAVFSVVATVVLGAFGKGRARLLIVGSAISIFFVDLLLAMLEMD
jgi:hypothetical protein